MIPILDFSTDLSMYNLSINHILAVDEFIVYHQTLRQNLSLKLIEKTPAEADDISNWIDLPGHSNVVTAFDQLKHDKHEFALTECSNEGPLGNMYKYI